MMTDCDKEFSFHEQIQDFLEIRTYLTVHILHGNMEGMRKIALLR